MMPLKGQEVHHQGEQGRQAHHIEQGETQVVRFYGFQVDISMKYTIGNYTLSNATLQVQHRPVRLSNSLLQLMVITHNVSGKIRAATQAELHQQIGNFEAAFSQSNIAHAGLFFDNGTPTHHLIRTSATLDGIKLIDGPNYPVGIGAEYAAFRTIQFSLQAEVRNTALNLLNFQESLSISGGTRPSAWLIPADENSSPIQQRLPRVPYVITQSGSAESYSQAFIFPNPLGEEPDEATKTNSGPEYSAGRMATYKWQWSYRWSTIQNPAGLYPTDRRISR